MVEGLLFSYQKCLYEHFDGATIIDPPYIKQYFFSLVLPYSSVPHIRNTNLRNTSPDFQKQYPPLIRTGPSLKKACFLFKDY